MTTAATFKSVSDYKTQQLGLANSALAWEVLKQANPLSCSHLTIRLVINQVQRIKFNQSSHSISANGTASNATT